MCINSASVNITEEIVRASVFVKSTENRKKKFSVYNEKQSFITLNNITKEYLLPGAILIIDGWR